MEKPNSFEEFTAMRRRNRSVKQAEMLMSNNNSTSNMPIDSSTTSSSTSSTSSNTNNNNNNSTFTAENDAFIASLQVQQYSLVMIFVQILCVIHHLLVTVYSSELKALSVTTDPNIPRFLPPMIPYINTTIIYLSYIIYLITFSEFIIYIISSIEKKNYRLLRIIDGILLILYGIFLITRASPGK